MHSVYIVDDDDDVRASTAFYLQALGFAVRTYSGGREFLADADGLLPGCVLLDVRMPVMSGLDVLAALKPYLATLPVIVMTGHGDVATAVNAMKAGASDFIEKPFDETLLSEMLARVATSLAAVDTDDDRRAALAKLKKLTLRESDVLRELSTGLSNKVVAHELGISVRTVEMHRASMMERLGVRTFADALRITCEAGGLERPVGAV